MNDTKIAHLGFIQGVITRMGGNSLALKGAAMALTTAVIAVMGAVPDFNTLFILAAIAPIGLFWFMDAQYLKLERQFRKLYDAIRLNQDVAEFSMNPAPFKSQVDGLLKIAFSWSVIWFYSILVVILGLAAYIASYSCKVT